MKHRTQINMYIYPLPLGQLHFYNLPILREIRYEIHDILMRQKSYVRMWTLAARCMILRKRNATKSFCVKMRLKFSRDNYLQGSRVSLTLHCATLIQSIRLTKCKWSRESQYSTCPCLALLNVSPSSPLPSFHCVFRLACTQDLGDPPLPSL